MLPFSDSGVTAELAVVYGRLWYSRCWREAVESFGTALTSALLWEYDRSPFAGGEAGDYHRSPTNGAARAPEKEVSPFGEAGASTWNMRVFFFVVLVSGKACFISSR